MVAVPSDDGFHTARGGDTLDAFGPLTHRAQQQPVEGHPPQWMKISSSFVRQGADGVVMERIRIRQEDYVPESAGLMHVKT